MALPKKIKIGPFTYNFCRSKDNFDSQEAKEIEDKNIIGLTDNKTLLLYVDQGLASGIEREVALHETLHAIFYANGLTNMFGRKKEEIIVNAYAVGVLQLLRDNPSFVSYLQEKD